MRLTTLPLLFAAFSIFAQDKPLRIEVDAGEFERQGTVVFFQHKGMSAFAQAKDGAKLPVQGKGDEAVFIVPRLSKGEKRVFAIMPDERAVAAAQVAVMKDGTRYHFRAGEKALMAYQAEPSELPRENIKPIFKRGAYIHPIQTLSGKVVTDDYPANHIHHHGVWWAWTNTEFEGRKPDFWNMGEGKGKVDFVAVDKTWSGPVHAGLVARHDFVDMTGAAPKVALKEQWELTVFQPLPGSSAWVFDLTSTQNCATDAPLKLPEYRYGGIGLRGNWAWNGKDKVQFLTSEGETDRDKGNATRGRWCSMHGLLNNQAAGITILSHPYNFRAPQPMRLHPTEPFFNFAPQQAGPMEIAPGKTYVARYRFIVHDGAPKREEMDRLWNDYAHPPKVTVLQ